MLSSTRAACCNTLVIGSVTSDNDPEPVLQISITLLKGVIRDIRLVLSCTGVSFASVDAALFLDLLLYAWYFVDYF